MLKLNSCRVFEHVAIVEVGMRGGGVRVEWIEEFRGRWCEAEAHVWELIVYQTRIKTGNQAT